MGSLRIALAFGTLVVGCGSRSELDDATGTHDAAVSVDGAHETDPPQTVEAGAEAGCASCAGTCDDGRCVVVLDEGPACALAVDGTSVYWTDPGAPPPTGCTHPPCYDGAVRKVSKDGGAQVTLAVGLPQPCAVAVDATNVYWGVFYALMKAPVAGGVPAVVVPWTMAETIAVDSANAYWTNSMANTVMKVALDGGAPITIASGQSWVHGLTIDAANVYWAVPGTEPTGYTDGWVMKAPIAGGAPTMLASGQLLPASIAVDTQRVYWTGYGPTAGSLSETTLDGGMTSVLAANEDYPHQVVVDGASVYWTTQGTIPNDYVDGAVHKMPLGGGAITTIAAGQHSAQGVVVDDTSVYWIAGGAVMKATPK